MGALFSPVSALHVWPWPPPRCGRCWVVCSPGSARVALTEGDPRVPSAVVPTAATACGPGSEDRTAAATSLACAQPLGPMVTHGPRSPFKTWAWEGHGCHSTPPWVPALQLQAPPLQEGMTPAPPNDTQAFPAGGGRRASLPGWWLPIISQASRGPHADAPCHPKNKTCLGQAGDLV